MENSTFKEKLARNEYTYGIHVVGPVNPLIPGWMVSAGIDFAFICNEHIPLDRSETSQMCMSFAACGISPMVRIPYPDDRLAIVAVEGGAEGVVAPYVEKPSDFIDIINALRYRPIKGEFLRDIVSGRRKPAPKLADHMERLNKNLYFVAGVESVYAIENLDAILETDGVDAIFLGPHDITFSLEIPCEYDNPLFINTLIGVIKKCRKAGKPVGLHCRPLIEHYTPLLEAGMNFIINAADVTNSIQLMKQDIDIIRTKYEQR